MRNLYVGLVLALITLLAPTARAVADVTGTASGFIVGIEPNFDGNGACRLIIHGSLFNVIDCPDGFLGDFCANLPWNAFIEVDVQDTELVPCNTVTCTRSSAMNHYIATGLPH